jgi:hypothetical protein
MWAVTAVWKNMGLNWYLERKSHQIFRYMTIKNQLDLTEGFILTPR